MLCRVLTVKSLDPEGAVHLADLQVPLLAKKDIAGNTTGGKGDWISTGLYTSDPTISPLTLPSFCAASVDPTEARWPDLLRWHFVGGRSGPRSANSRDA